MSYRKGIELHIVSSSVYVRSDPILLEQIIGNFVANAIRYTETGRVLLGCRRRKGKLSIEVLDTGPGIPKHQRDAIFDDFHQLDNKERDRGKGLGLGLAIVRRLSICLDHQIEHSSEVNQGSRFAVIVELGNKPAKLIQSRTYETSLLDLNNTSVLLIEDDVIVLNATQQLLESWKCNVICAKSAQEAERLMFDPQYIPDIIIADYRLPGSVNGVQAINNIAAKLGYPVPAFIITGEANTSEVRKIADHGYRVLSKPVHPAKLRALISHLLIESNETSLKSDQLKVSVS